MAAADTTESFSPTTSAPSVSYRQSISPHFMYGTFIKNDTFNHEFVVDGRGKSWLTVGVWSTGGSSWIATVYGMHNSTSLVGTVGVFQIAGGGFTSTGISGNYNVISDPFPFYRLRFQNGTTATDSTTAPGVSVYVYADCTAF